MNVSRLASTYPLRLGIGLLLPTIAMISASMVAQSVPSKTPSPEGSATGFSIESEMLTYRALESNSEAIACEVTAYLAHSSPHFTKQPAGKACDVSVADPDIKVVVLPLNSSVVADFQMWRSDMQSMEEMIRRGTCATATQPTPAQPGEESATPKIAVRGGGSVSPLSLIPTNPISAAQAVLGLFATGTSTTAVGGTIEDQAFMDNVGRDLGTLHVSVLSPSLYGPGALAPIDPQKSPFLIALGNLMTVYDCLYNNPKGPTDPRVTNIDSFLKMLSGSSSTAQQGANAAAKTQASANPPNAEPIATTSSHLYTVLSADSLAQSLGVGVDGKIADLSKIHVLLLKALESGGEVSRTTNILKTKASYSGGSVGTFTLFGLGGRQECSGNVYTYAGPIPSKNFDAGLRAYAPDPGAQMIFQHGNCPNLP